MPKTNPSCICMHCLNPNDAATSEDPDLIPQEGDVCICAYCYTIGKYQKNLMIKPITKDELNVFAKDYPEEYEKLQIYLQALKKFNK